jgi:hypothetical protein
VLAVKHFPLYVGSPPKAGDRPSGLVLLDGIGEVTGERALTGGRVAAGCRRDVMPWFTQDKQCPTE